MSHAHADLAHVAAVLGALACFPVLLGRNRAILAGLGLLAAAELSMAFALVPGSDLKLLVTSPVRAAAFVGAGLVVVGIAFLFNRHPGVAPVALLVAAPFRIGVSLGSQYARLLLPLYGVLAAASLALAWRLLRKGPARRIDRSFAVPSAALICLYSLSLLWAKDGKAGSIELAAFLFPFLALVAVIVYEPSRSWLPRTLAFVLIGEAVFFSAFGLWEEATHTVYFSPALEISNTYTSYFRTNSLFSDPNIYGRHLALAVSVLVVLLWPRRRLLSLTALIAFIWVGLYYSYSLTSLAALFVVVVGITLVVGGRRTRRAIVICTAALAFAGMGLAVVGVQGHSLRNVTSGRSHLASITFDVFADHPLTGVGVGSQPLAAQNKKKVSANSTKRDASHTTPLTVAAELGIVGLAAYLAWFAGAFVTLRKAWKRDATVGLALAAVFGVLFVHSLSYSGFFEDPITWGALALAAAYAVPPRDPESSTAIRA